MFLTNLFAGVFIAAFFAALPVWFLTRVEGRVRFTGEGSNPWRCTVSSQWLWRTRVRVFEPSRIAGVERSVRFKTRTSPAWQIRFDLPGGAAPVEVLAGLSTNRAVPGLADRLEAARASSSPIEAELPADLVYYLAIGLVILFAACGFFIAFSAA